LDSESEDDVIARQAAGIAASSSAVLKNSRAAATIAQAMPDAARASGAPQGALSWKQRYSGTVAALDGSQIKARFRHQA